MENKIFDFGSPRDLDRFHVRGRGDVMTFRLTHEVASELVNEDVRRTNGNSWICRPAREIIVNESSFKIKEISQFHSCFPDDSGSKTYGFLIGDTVIPESPVYDWKNPNGFRLIPKGQT